jgi:orotate phosphoribosyltransferase
MMEDYKKRLARILAETGARGSFFSDMMLKKDLVNNTDIVLGPSYKGSSIAVATAIALWKEHGLDVAFDYDRKEAKTHGEATASKSIFVNRTFFDGCRIFIVDDVATSMRTKYDLLEKIMAEARGREMQFKVVGIGIAIDREQTTAVYDKAGKVVLGQKGENAIQDFISKSSIPVYCIAGVKEIIEYLYREKIPVMVQGRRVEIDEKTKAEFDKYIEIYGVG